MKAIATLVVLVTLTAASAANASGLCDMFSTDPSVRDYCNQQAAARDELARTKTEVVESRVERTETIRARDAVTAMKHACGACMAVPDCRKQPACVRLSCYTCESAKAQVVTVRAGVSRKTVAKMIALALEPMATDADLVALEDRLNLKIGELDGRVKALEEKIPELERRIAALEEAVKDILDRLGKLEKRVGALEEYAANDAANEIEQNKAIAGIGKEFDLRLGLGFAGAKSIYAFGGGVGADFGMTKSLKLTLDAQLGYSLDSAFSIWGDLGLMWFTESEVFGVGGGAVTIFEAVEDGKDLFIGAGVMLRLQQPRLDDKEEKRTARIFGQLTVAGGVSSTRWGEPDAGNDRPRLYDGGAAVILGIGVSFNP